MTHTLPVKYDELDWTTRRQVRLQYIREQGMACHHCKAPLNGPPHPDIKAKSVRPELFPKDFFYYPVHLHHSRETGLTIGAVHAHCNAVLWEYHGE